MSLSSYGVVDCYFQTYFWITTGGFWITWIVYENNIKENEKLWPKPRQYIEGFQNISVYIAQWQSRLKADSVSKQTKTNISLMDEQFRIGQEIGFKAYLSEH